MVLCDASFWKRLPAIHVWLTSDSAENKVGVGICFIILLVVGLLNVNHSSPFVTGSDYHSAQKSIYDSTAHNHICSSHVEYQTCKWFSWLILDECLKLYISAVKNSKKKLLIHLYFTRFYLKKKTIMDLHVVTYKSRRLYTGGATSVEKSTKFHCAPFG